MKTKGARPRPVERLEQKGAIDEQDRIETSSRCACAQTAAAALMMRDKLISAALPFYKDKARATTPNEAGKSGEATAGKRSGKKERIKSVSNGVR